MSETNRKTPTSILFLYLKKEETQYAFINDFIKKT